MAQASENKNQVVDCTFTQAEVDALIAAAVRQAAMVASSVTTGVEAGNRIRALTPADAQKALDGRIATAVGIFIGGPLTQLVAESQVAGGWTIGPHQLIERARALADPNALAEHDAALRDALKLQTEVFREQKSKLEAENAGLRQELGDCKDALLTTSRQLEDARALLGEKT